MCVAILTVYLPLQLFLAAMGIRDTVMTTTTKMAADTTGGGGAESAAEAQPLQTYSFGRIHSEIAGSSPEHRYAWSAILFIPSWLVPFYVMNQPYVAVLTAGVVFAFFGLGDEAKEMYKVYARWWWCTVLCQGRGKGRRFGDADNEGWEMMVVRNENPNERNRHRRRDQYDISDDNLDIDAAMPSKPGDSSRREQ